MKELSNGHRFELSGFDNPDNTQIIQFIEKEKFSESTEMKTVNDGTTNEEVLEMMIVRMNYLQKRFPCKANAIVITNLEESLLWLNKRTADRITRNVEGKHLA